MTSPRGIPYIMGGFSSSSSLEVCCSFKFKFVKMVPAFGFHFGIWHLESDYGYLPTSIRTNNSGQKTTKQQNTNINNNNNNNNNNNGSSSNKCWSSGTICTKAPRRQHRKKRTKMSIMPLEGLRCVAPCSMPWCKLTNTSPMPLITPLKYRPSHHRPT
jgi:hypothetical protein